MQLRWVIYAYLQLTTLHSACMRQRGLNPSTKSSRARALTGWHCRLLARQNIPSLIRYRDARRFSPTKSIDNPLTSVAVKCLHVNYSFNSYTNNVVNFLKQRKLLECFNSPSHSALFCQCTKVSMDGCACYIVRGSQQQNMLQFYMMSCLLISAFIYHQQRKFQGEVSLYGRLSMPSHATFRNSTSHFRLAQRANIKILGLCNTK